MSRKAFLYRLYPSRSQARLLDATLETCRFFYNDCLAERKTAYEERGETIGKYEQLRRVKARKATNPYAKNVHSHVLQTVVQDLDKAFDAFFRRVKAPEQSAAVLRELGLDKNPAAGQVLHREGPMEGGGMQIVDVWGSQEAFETFVQDRLASAFQKAGTTFPADMQPKAVWPVTGILK